MTPLLVIRALASSWDNLEARNACLAIESVLAQAPADAVIYRGRNTLTRVSFVGHEVVVKAFPAPRTLLKRIQRWGRASKAMRSFEHAMRMLQLGISTPEPIAVIEANDGRAWYLCRFAANYIPAGRAGSSDEIIAALGGFLGRMHACGAFHYDATPGNFLLRVDDLSAPILVVDCNRMRFGGVSAWAGTRSLMQLRNHDERLLRSYCAARGWSGGLIRKLYYVRWAWHHAAWACKNATHPLRRKCGI
jgi:tRNA A-37 threonylcarbamoyl transferase component Bud32